MPAQGADKFLHGLQAAAHGPRAPLLEKPAGPVGAPVIPENVKGLLEEIGPHGLEITMKQIGELFVLLGSEVLSSFEETVASPFQERLKAPLFERFGLVLAHLIDGLVEFLGDVEAVENVQGVGQFFGDDLEVGLPHIAAYDLDVLAALPAQAAEDLEQGLGGTAFANEEQALETVIDLVDEGQVMMAQTVGDLIDADGVDGAEDAVLEAIIDHPLDGAADRVPGSAKGLGGLRPGQYPGPAAQEEAEDVASPFLAGGPGDLFDHDPPAVLAIDPAHLVTKTTMSPQKGMKSKVRVLR